MALLCILSGLEVCSHVVLRVNDLRISAIIPKSKNCCPTLQGRHAERVYYPPALTLPNIFRRKLLVPAARAKRIGTSRIG